MGGRALDHRAIVRKFSDRSWESWRQSHSALISPENGTVLVSATFITGWEQPMGDTATEVNFRAWQLKLWIKDTPQSEI